MNSVAIPAWNAHGVIPPINPHQPTGPERSPYRVALADLILRFGTSRERRSILAGLLRYRAELHQAGLVEGFQWLDGSFLENVEHLEARAPRDVDIVTFVQIPTGFTPGPRVRKLFDHDWVKANFLVDHYFVELSLPGHQLVSFSAYWYSLWSHRREQQWKGYLEIDLSPADDEAARANLFLEESSEEQR